MERWEANIYMKGIAIMAFGIIAAVFLMTLPVSAKKAVFTDDSTADEYFTEEDAETPKKGQIREDSGMPCENPEQFKKWMETYEQETSEEDADEASNVEMGEEMGRYPNRQEEVEAENLSNAEEMETAQSDNVRVASQSEVVYSVNGETLNPELQALLYDALDRHGISYFFEIAVAQCYQESHFNTYAINPHNNEDMGVLQYKNRFWDWSRGDIFDPAVQFELYAEQMAARLNAGLSADECISRHNTSDYVTAINWQYVSDVKQHLATMREVK